MAARRKIAPKTAMAVPDSSPMMYLIAPPYLDGTALTTRVFLADEIKKTR